MSKSHPSIDLSHSKEQLSHAADAVAEKLTQGTTEASRAAKHGVEQARGAAERSVGRKGGRRGAAGWQGWHGLLLAATVAAVILVLSKRRDFR